MSNEVDGLISNGDISEALESCRDLGYYHLGLLLAKIVAVEHIGDIRFIQEWGRLIDQVPIKVVVKEQKPIPSPSPSSSRPLLPPETQISVITEEPEERGIEIIEDESDEEDEPGIIRVRLLCNWDSSEGLCALWNKMSKGDKRWNNIKIVSVEKNIDYYVVINCPPIGFTPNPMKTIIFRMEPNMEEQAHMWGEWAKPDPDKYAKVCYHDTEHNNVEWHISKTYTELMEETIEKDPELEKILSTVLSDKYRDPGHILRIDFVKFLEDEEQSIHVFGNDKFDYIDYKGTLPSHKKDDALFPYKYTFNAENHSIEGYFTEKLIDGILSECLTFYWGAYGTKEYIDERAYVFLDLEDFDKSLDTIKKAIEEDWWSQRIEYIRAEKKRILNEMQFFPRLEKILSEIKNE